jgi:serine/threonine protein kinase
MIYAVKVVSKALIKRKREERHIMAERDVLVKNTRHPFLVSLQYSFQTPDKLYFVMDFVNGGEVCYLVFFTIKMMVNFSFVISYSSIYNKKERLVNNVRDFMQQK